MAPRRSAPRRLVTLIALVTILPLGLLLGFGWRWLADDRQREQDQTRERLLIPTDRIVAALERSLASTEQDLSRDRRDWPQDAVVVEIEGDDVSAYPSSRLAYWPTAVRLREARPDTFDAVDQLELVQQNGATDAALRRLLVAPDRATRATADFRLAGTMARAGRIDAALAAYARLTDVDDIGIEQVPIGLAARYRRCKLFETAARERELQVEATTLTAELVAGRWPVTSAVYTVYADQAWRWRADKRSVAASEQLAEAV